LRGNIKKIVIITIFFLQKIKNIYRNDFKSHFDIYSFLRFYRTDIEKFLINLVGKTSNFTRFKSPKAAIK